MELEASEITTSSAWLDPALIVSAICIVLASVIVPILLHVLKARREREDKIFEMRKEIYSEYFRRFEEAAKGVGIDYERFSKVTLKDAFRELLEADNSPEAILRFQDTVGEFPHQIQESHRKVTEEITTLKILCSEKLLQLTAEFEQLNQELFEMSSEWLAEMQNSLSVPDSEAPIARKMEEKGKRVKIVKDEIIAQMRLELKIDK